MSATHDCPACSDTRRMTIGDREVPCTRCPRPCQDCRIGGNGAYCAQAPCRCDCHIPKTSRGFCLYGALDVVHGVRVRVVESSADPLDAAHVYASDDRNAYGLAMPSPTHAACNGPIQVTVEQAEELIAILRRFIAHKRGGASFDSLATRLVKDQLEHEILDDRRLVCVDDAESKQLKAEMWALAQSIDAGFAACRAALGLVRP